GDHEGHRFVEGEVRPTVEEGERHVVDLQRRGQHRTLPARTRFGVAQNRAHRRMGENRTVKGECVFCLIVEPQAGGKFLHGRASSTLMLCYQKVVARRGDSTPWANFFELPKMW